MICWQHSTQTAAAAVAAAAGSLTAACCHPWSHPAPACRAGLQQQAVLLLLLLVVMTRACSWLQEVRLYAATVPLSCCVC
jgi:hypothetical protein